MSTKNLSEIAHWIDKARLEVREIERLTLKYPDLHIHDAYAIQEKGISLRLARGEKTIGYKMGLTSQAKREQMNLSSPIYGVLTDKMRIQEKTFSMKTSIHPKIEPEIVFFTQEELKGKVSIREVLTACSGVSIALEILDSRYLNFKYFSLPDVVADNSSSAYFILGETVQNPFELKLSELEMVMKVNGKVVQKALSQSISGNPAQSVVQLCELLSHRGLTLPAGSVVLAGAATPAIALEKDSEIQLTVDQLGSIDLKITE